MRPMFTVFTPTYNRATTLTGCFLCLSAQTFTNFEWIIVDDGSSDETSQLVKDWQRHASYRIRYLWQENQGKPTAFNRAVQEAQGNLILNLDSDDTCVPLALERFLYYWNSIPLAKREEFSGVTAHCMTPQGNLVGDLFPSSPLDCSSLDTVFRYRVSGEKWGFIRVDLMRKFPFPIFRGEKYISESIVWNRLARIYRTRFVNEMLRIYQPNADGVTSSSVRVRAGYCQSSQLVYREMLDLPIPLRARLRAAANYVRFSRHARTSYSTMVRRAPNPALVIASVPMGVAAYYLDRRLLSEHPQPT